MVVLGFLGFVFLRRRVRDRRELRYERCCAGVRVRAHHGAAELKGAMAGPPPPPSRASFQKSPAPTAAGAFFVISGSGRVCGLHADG